MQSAFVSALVSAVKTSWPVIEPMLLQAGVKLIAEAVALAKSQSFSANWKWLEPIIAAAGDEIMAKLPSA